MYKRGSYFMVAPAMIWSYWSTNMLHLNTCSCLTRNKIL